MSSDRAYLKEIARALFEQALEECSIERAFDRKLRVVEDAAGTRLMVEEATRLLSTGCGGCALYRWARLRRRC